MKRVMLKSSKWLSLTIVSFILLTLLLLWVLLFTPPGLKMISWAANHFVPSLSIGSVQGSLFPRFTLREVVFRDQTLGLDVRVGEVTLGNHFRCLLTPKVCVQELALTHVEVTLLPSPSVTSVSSTNVPATSDESPTVNQPFTFSTPFPLAVNRLLPDDVKLDIDGTKIQWQQFHSGASMLGSTLTIDKTEWQGISLSLPPSEPQAAQSDGPIVLPEVLLPFAIDLKRLDVKNFILALDDPLTFDHVALSAQGKQHQIKLSQVELTMAALTASLNGEIALTGDYPLDVVIDATWRGAPFDAQKLHLHAQQSVGKLALDTEWQGDIKGAIVGTLEPLEPHLPFAVKKANASTQWPFKGAADYQFSVDSLTGSGSLQGYQFALLGNVKGKSIPAVTIDTKGKGNLEQVEFKALSLDGLGGNVAGSGLLNWQTPLNWQASLTLKDIQPGLQWPDAEGSLSGSLETSGHLLTAGGWYVTLPKVNIDGLLRGYPINIQGEFTAQDRDGQGSLKLNSDLLVLTHGPNSLSLKGHLDQDWSMRVGLDLPILAKSVPDLTGALKGQLTLNGPFKTPDVFLDVNAEKMAWQQQVSIESLQLKGQVAVSDDPQGDLRLDAKALRYQERLLDSLQMVLKGRQSQQTLDINIFSDWLTTSLGIQGGLQLKPEQIWSGALQHMQFTTPQGTWSLNQSTAINANLTQGEVDIKGHCWTQSDSSICLSDMTKVGKQGEASLTINQFNFDQLQDFIPKQTKITGQFDAKGQIKWAPQQAPYAQLSIKLPKGQVVQQLDAPIMLGWQSVTLNATLDNNQLRADWRLDMTDNGDLSGELQLDNVDSGDPVMAGKLSLSTFSLDFLQPLVGEYSKIDGDVQTDLTVKGDLLHPQVFGEINVSNIALNGEITPVDVTKGDLSVTLNGYQGSLTSKIETPDGVLKLSGDGHWQDLSAWHSQIRVFANELEVDLPPTVKVKVQPDMTIVLAPRKVSVGGKINLPWGRVVIEELPRGAISVSKDLVLVNAKRQPISSAVAQPFNIQTDVQIHVGDDFKLSAFGLEGELAGQLKVTQRDKGPFIVGEVNILNGTYQSFGQDLIIKEGKVLMNGPVDQPYVAITAIRNPENTEDEVTAGVKVTGLASEPTITIFSEPAMPQANALSYLLRGQDIGTDSGDSADTMTSMLIGLSLAQSGQIVGDIGKAFGVQDLQLGTSGTGDDSQVTVSGYIAPGLQIKYGVGIFKPVGEFTVRYRLMRDLYIEAVSGLESALDVLYQFEFN